MRTFPRAHLLSECVFDRVVDLNSVAFDALGVDPEQHVHGVASALSDLRRGNTSVEPQRHRSVAQIVGTPGQRRRHLRWY